MLFGVHPRCNVEHDLYSTLPSSVVGVHLSVRSLSTCANTSKKKISRATGPGQNKQISRDLGKEERRRKKKNKKKKREREKETTWTSTRMVVSRVKIKSLLNIYQYLLCKQSVATSASKSFPQFHPGTSRIHSKAWIGTHLGLSCVMNGRREPPTAKFSKKEGEVTYFEWFDDRTVLLAKSQQVIRKFLCRDHIKASDTG